MHTDGNPLIPACLMAITKGDDVAVPVLKVRSAWLEGTKRPITVVPPM